MRLTKPILLDLPQFNWSNSGNQSILYALPFAAKSHSRIGLSNHDNTSKGEFFGAMNWIQRKIYLYNVTFGLFMLDWWERYLFNGLIVVLMWFICYNTSKYISDLYIRFLR